MVTCHGRFPPRAPFPNRGDFGPLWAAPALSVAPATATRRGLEATSLRFALVPALDPVWLGELSEFLRIPSVSADPANRDDVRRAAEWVCEYVRASGGECEVVPERGERPLVIGEIRASRDADAAATVLVYGHFDVQPPAPLEEWVSPPFEPTIRDEWIYARGIADDKGQLYLLLKAARLLAAEEALPVNVRVAFDGEEEIGGRSIVNWIAEDERGADACVIFDAHMPKRGQPAFYIATRGLCYFHVRIRSGGRDLHSGTFGGAALNGMHALIQTLSGVLPRNGRLPDQLREGLIRPTEEELADWASQAPGGQVLAGQSAQPADPLAAEEFYLRTWGEPSLDVHGLAGGSPRLQKTVIPAAGEANLSIRLAPGQHPDTIAPVVEQLLREAAPEGADVDIELWSSAPPGLIPPDSAAIRLGQAAFERAIGARPLLLRSGGTLPIVPALADRGIPTIVSGFDLPEGNLHSPNERFLIENIPLGVAAARELFTALAGLR
jgi:acetylornithine deacetylase/succinyl-diaminopimelate desuccinylase-like protein